MCDFWEAIEKFDPHTADPHFCWALLEMETERYINIRNGKIIPTEKVWDVSPQAILDSPAPVWKCNTAKALLEMEAGGFCTIDGGNFTLTEKGKQMAIDFKIDEALAKYRSGDEATSPLEATRLPTTQVPERVFLEWKGEQVELSDRIIKCVLTLQKPGEGFEEAFNRLLEEGIAKASGTNVATGGDSEFQEFDKHVIWLEGTGQRLAAKGLLEAAGALTPKGAEEYKLLVASGWRPTPRTIRYLLRHKGMKGAELDKATALFLSADAHEPGK
jgi:hypothetical protein